MTDSVFTSVNNTHREDMSMPLTRLFEPGSETVTIQKGMPANLVELDFRPTNGDIRIRQTVMGQWSTKST